MALLAAIGLLASAVFSSEWRLGMVLGDSMSPALHSGQWFLLERGAYSHAAPRKGEIIVFHHRNITYVKRIVGAAGDTVWLMEQPDDEGRWLSPVYPDLLSRARRLSQRNLGARLVGVRVPPHHVYVVGDMFTASVDSRKLGPIPISEIEGRVRPSFGLGHAAFADSAR